MSDHEISDQRFFKSVARNEVSMVTGPKAGFPYSSPEGLESSTVFLVSLFSKCMRKISVLDPSPPGQELGNDP